MQAKKKGCGCKHSQAKKKKPCCSACAVGLPCGTIVKHIQEDSKVFRHMLAEDRELIRTLRGEGMATKKRAAKKTSAKKKTTAKRKTAAKRKKGKQPTMTRKQACIVLCRQKWSKKAKKKK